MQTPILPLAVLPGEIREDAVYRLDELKGRLGLNDEALRKARRAGLRARKVGRRKLYIGREVIAFLKGLPEV
jgi:hypothetical protein